jgi:hypothetical protein
LAFFGKDANLYRYCRNAPTIDVDPKGTATFGIGLAGDAEAWAGVTGGAEVTLSINGWNPFDWRIGLAGGVSGGLITGVGGHGGVVGTVSAASKPEEWRGTTACVGVGVSPGPIGGAVSVGNIAIPGGGPQGPITVNGEATVGSPGVGVAVTVGPTVAGSVSPRGVWQGYCGIWDWVFGN